MIRLLGFFIKSSPLVYSPPALSSKLTAHVRLLEGTSEASPQVPQTVVKVHLTTQILQFETSAKAGLESSLTVEGVYKGVFKLPSLDRLTVD